MRRIGILGGTFDPIHFGHLSMAQYALSEMNLDEIWIMPTGCPAYKNKLHSVSPADDRYNMAELAINNKKHMKISSVEIDREGSTYTADTLVFLKQEYPDTQFYYIIGSDSFDYIEKWYKPEIIFSNAVLLIVMRNTEKKEDIEKKIICYNRKFSLQAFILHGRQVDMSSTEIRNLVFNKKPISRFVPADVEKYIDNKGLYSKNT